MATSRNTEHVRFRYGRCLNDECENCKSKTVIEIPARKDFVCPVCGKELHECPPPKKKSNGMLYGIIAAVVVIAGVVAWISLSGGNDEYVVPEEEKVATEVVTVEESLDTAEPEPVVEEVPPVEDAKPENKPVENKPAVSTSRSKDLGYATWKGALKNGQPNDENGTMTYKESHRIDSRDPQARVAEPGDYIIGEFVDGKLVQGIWYDKSNTVKGSIIIGR